MQLKGKSLKILLMIAIMSIVLSIGSVVFGADFSIADPPVEPYLYDNKLFCINKTQGYWLENVPGQNNSTRVIEYDEQGRIPLEQSIAYALYTAIKTNNWDAANLQNIIWASGQFEGQPNYEKTLEGYEEGTTTSPTSSNALIARSNQFAEVYYGILKGGNKLQFTSQSNNTRVLVDYTDQTYTVGPYKIDVNTGDLSGAVKDAKSILYDELAGVNASKYPNSIPFAEYEITGLDGTEMVFLDKGGNEIKFPNWGEDFYIRYKPNNGVTTINPKINIHYLKKITIYGIKLEGSEGTVDGYYYIGNNGIREDLFNPSDYIKTGTLKENSNYGASINVEVESFDTVKSIRKEFDYTDSEGNDHYKDVTYIVAFTYKAKITVPSRLQDLIKVEISGEGNFEGEQGEFHATPEYDDAIIDLGTKEVSMELGGNVWLDLPSVKTADITGVKSGEDTPFAGIEVRLYDESGNLVGVTATNSEGKYHFYNLDPLKKYYVTFVYNGQIYQATYYKNNLTGGYSNAQDINRDAFNNLFGSIDSSPKDYKVGNEWHKSYALLSKLAMDNGEYIENGKDENGNTIALKFEDAWNKFLELSEATGSYEKAYSELANWLRSKGVGSSDCNGVIVFIRDCMINATTLVDDPLTKENALVKYPVYDRFVLEDINNPTDEVETVTLDRTYSYLYTKKSDQSRYVDFGITRREQEDLYLQKDVYKATVIVNGKIHDYMYSKKNVNDDGSWSVEVRASDELFNGAYTYSRELRKSEYLYNGEDAGTSNAKNLQVYVTYRILLLNRSQALYSTINEIVDYYDADQYSFDGTLRDDGTYAFNSYNKYDENGNVTSSYVNSYIGTDANGGKLENSNLIVSNHTKFADRESKKTLANGNYKYDSLYLTGIKTPSGNDRLAPGERAYVYVTFKANIDPATGKVKLDQDLNTGNITVGKRNIAEINGYSNSYGQYSIIPGYLDNNNARVDTSVANKTAGIIDTRSNAGSLAEIDLTNDGDLRTSTNNEVENRLEMDTDKAPNIKVVISQNDDDTRRVSGLVYEDERTVTNDKAVVGNGKYENGENLINGVKVELVELVQNVDNNGIFLGGYSGEKVWGTVTYDFQDGVLVKTSENNDRYFSGFGTSKVILKGPGILDVSEDDLGQNNGQYSFKSVPAGDFMIRFTYGDGSQTVLTNADNEVNNLLGVKGLNAKSYNGQDYKTTTYQTEIDQNTSYNGIKGFTNYETQNYNNGTDKSAMYYYDIEKSANVKGASDAKDVYSYRQRSNDWSTTLLNNKAEILNSFESLGTYKYETSEEQRQAQVNKINSLIANTAMVAQTGVIDTEVEYNSKSTQNQGNNNKLAYTIGDVDLGLQERPEAQLKLNKEITNFKLTLANNQTLFDTTQSVHNLYYAKHSGHSVKYNGFRLAGYEIGRNSKQLPELIQAYMDEELISGANIEAKYELSIENVGEVDYLDKQFYYTGKTAHPEDSNWVSKTSAKEVIDYISNLSKYEANYQDIDADWKVRNYGEIITSSVFNNNNELVIDETKVDNDLVNRKYLNEVSTYNTIITTEKLSADLLPELFNKDNSKATTKLVLTSSLSNSNNGSFVYNNLAEIVKTSNSQGRRMSYSIVGNQQMADQSLGDDASEELFSNIDLVTPSEIDADSAQKIVILPPTGENRAFIPIIITAIAVASIIIVGVVIIKRRVN